MLMNKLFTTVALGALMTISSACLAAPVADSVTVGGAYIRAVPAGQTVSAAFMTLKNTTANAHSLVKASSAVANTVELHTHSNHNGVMEMRQVPKIGLPAGAAVALQPGGFHIMLIGLKQTLSAGTTAKVTLTFEDGSTKVVSAPVR